MSLLAAAELKISDAEKALVIAKKNLKMAKEEAKEKKLTKADLRETCFEMKIKNTADGKPIGDRTTFAQLQAAIAGNKGEGNLCL